MTRLFHPFLALIASSTDRELARYIEYLKAENKILRARIPGRVHTKPAERKRLLKLGKVLGKAIEELISIVTPSTFYRWVRDESDEPRKRRAKGGRRKPPEIRELVVVIAKQTGFEYTRIIGELRSRGSVAGRFATSSRKRESNPARIARQTRGQISCSDTPARCGPAISFP